MRLRKIDRERHRRVGRKVGGRILVWEGEKNFVWKIPLWVQAF